MHVDVDGLEPASTYWYGFRALDTDSPVARTRTLPEQTDHCRFAMVSCAKFNAGFFNVYPRIAARDDLDFLLHLGDYIYEASNTPPASQTPGADIGRPFDPLGECVTLDDYRTRYNQYHRDPDVQAAPRPPPDHPHARRPRVRRRRVARRLHGAQGRVRTVGEPARATRSRRARSGCRSRRPDPDDPERVWRSVAVGALADIFLIDTRTRRDEPVPEPAMSDPDRTAIGPGAARLAVQRDVAARPPRWRLLGNPSVLGRHLERRPERRGQARARAR